MSSSLLVVGGSSEASSSPPTAPVAPPAAAVGQPLGEDAVAVAREHLRGQAAELGLSAADIEQLEISSVVPSEHNGLTHVYFQQRVNSLDISSAMLNVAVTADREVLRVASSAVSGAAKLANATAPKVTDVAAVRAAADSLGLQPTESFASADDPEGPDRERELGDGGISADPIPARLVYQETKKGDLRLTWELVINQLDGEHWWQIRMDALSGAELDRTDWVAEDSHTVYPLPTEAPSFGSRVAVTNPADATASPFGWNDTNGAAGAESTLTTGNNVNAYTDTDANNVPDVGSSPNGGVGLNFNFPLDLTQPPSSYRPAAVTNLYYTNNRTHDILYRYGFTEAAGNFQVNNYGRGGAGGDAVNAEAQDGVGTNNANFSTPPDGTPPRMQMFVWTAPEPDRDGDLDNGIIVHEYGHGVSSRLTGGPANVGCLSNSEQAGEGWSDFLSYMLTMPNGTEPPGGRGIGTYALNQPTTGPGIRAFPYSTDVAVNPHTYDSIKSVAVPHGVGSVWAEMLWEMTYALIDEHGFSANLITGNAGNNKSLQLVMDGMKLQPCSPGFVDARDAILDADQASYGGENQCLIWEAFAKRGLGFSATQGSSASVADGTEAFDVPPACMGLVLTRTATPAPAEADRTLTYDLTLENTSEEPGGITGVTAAGHVGDHATYVPGSATCGGTYDDVAEVVTFAVGAMPLGTSVDCEFKVRIDASPFSETRFDDDFEPDLSAWAISHGAGTADWSLTTTGPHSPTNAAFASNPSGVSDQYLTSTDSITIAAGDQLSFWHSVDTEAGFDGGVVEVSTNGTTWIDVGAASFLQNGYTQTISASFGSPIAGRPAFTGSHAYRQSVVDLTSYAGQSIQVRFRMASDTSIADGGWTVDDVRIGTNVDTTSTGSASATGIPVQAVDLTTPIVEATSTAPAAPTVTGSTPSAGAVSVKFVPVSDGGRPISGYTAQCVSSDGGAARTASGASSPVKVTGLSAGKRYRCRVLATNEVGNGPLSGFGATVRVPAKRPGRPVITKSKAVSRTTATITFKKASDGGSRITSYQASCTSKNGGKKQSAVRAGSPIQVKKLTPGKKYRCQVRAKNVAGFGPWSKAGKAFVMPR